MCLTLQGFYNTMDSGLRDKDGYISVLSRTDDVINVAGHRLSCGVLEEVMHDAIRIVELGVGGINYAWMGRGSNRDK